MKTKTIIIIIIILLVSIIIGLFIGPARLSPEILQLRISRVLLGIFAGGIMAFCGAILQGLFGNPLVEPYTLGSASGAALGAALGLLLVGTISPFFAFLGALTTGSFVFIIARVKNGIIRDRLILAGVVMSFLCSSLVMIIMVIGGKELYEILYLLMGYLGIIINASNLFYIILLLIIAVILLALLYRYHRELDIISQGIDTAAGMGINIEQVSILIFIFISLLVGLIVSLVGAIGFVGLVVPHIARLLFGPKHIYNLPGSFILGAIFLVLADTIARTLTVYELPVGVVTSLIGVPFFIYLYMR